MESNQIIKKYPQKGNFVWIDDDKKYRLTESQSQIIYHFYLLVRNKSKYKKASYGHSFIMAIDGCLSNLIVKNSMLANNEEIGILRNLINDYRQNVKENKKFVSKKTYI